MACAVAKRLKCDCAFCERQQTRRCCAEHWSFICATCSYELTAALVESGDLLHCPDFKPKEEPNNAP